MKKCAQCGCDIPAGNVSCVNCGYNTKEIDSSYSFGQPQVGDGATTNANGGKAGKIILIVFLSIFGFSILSFIFVFAFVFSQVNTDEMRTCSSLCDGNFNLHNDICTCSLTDKKYDLSKED